VSLPKIKGYHLANVKAVRVTCDQCHDTALVESDIDALDWAQSHHATVHKKLLTGT